MQFMPTHFFQVAFSFYQMNRFNDHAKFNANETFCSAKYSTEITKIDFHLDIPRILIADFFFFGERGGG